MHEMDCITSRSVPAFTIGNFHEVRQSFAAEFLAWEAQTSLHNYEEDIVLQKLKKNRMEFILFFTFIIIVWLKTQII